MTDILQRKAVYLWYYFSVQFEQIFRYWALGLLIGSAVSVFLKNWIHNTFRGMGRRNLGIGGIIIASIIGIASPLCMYGTIPIAASFSKSGIRDDWLAAFMMSSILLNPQLIIYSAALGPTALMVRIISCILCGITAGLVIRLAFQNKAFFNFSGFAEPESHDTDPNVLFRYLKNLGRNVKATGVYFIIGVALSAVFQRYVPVSAMTALLGGNRAFGVLMSATIGGGTIPLLQQWLSEGMSMGGAAAFMITGPATKITNLGALKIALGIRNFIFYLLFALLFSLLAGVIVNLLF